MRQCGDCQLCCKLLPVRSPLLNKNGGEACKYQKFKKGCSVYHTAKMPGECHFWNCRWLVNDDTADLSRPDRSHYVIDVMPDFITISNNDTGAAQHVQVVQVWIDPRYPDAHRDPALRHYLERRGQEGTAALVRFNPRDAVTIFPPAMSDDGQWHEVRGASQQTTHTIEDVAQALGNVTLALSDR
jgi:hypothetical protein